jgi:nucleotide-binding universal stress UspA family protein
MRGRDRTGSVRPPHYDLHRIGVAYDESPESDYALSVARALAQLCHASLSALEVVSLPTVSFLAGPTSYDDLFTDLVRAAQDRLRALDDINAQASYGEPAEDLTLCSGSVDLLGVGSRDYVPVGSARPRQHLAAPGSNGAMPAAGSVSTGG